jgi:hypothetical protein
VRLVELLTVVSTFKKAMEDVERDTFGILSYVYEGLRLIQFIYQNIKWPTLAVGWQRAHADYRVRYLGHGTEGVIATPVHLQFGSGVRARALFAAILNPSVHRESATSCGTFPFYNGLFRAIA